MSYGSILLGLLTGYGIAMLLGLVDFQAVWESGWLALPRPPPYGLELHWGPSLLMAMVYVVSAVETIGDITGVVGAMGWEPTEAELKGGLIADGAMSTFAALFGGFPNTSFSQNVGLVNFTGVVSRHVTAVSGALLVGLGLVPKVSALFATVPPSVIGGSGFVMFAMIFSSGVALLNRTVAFNNATW